MTGDPKTETEGTAPKPAGDPIAETAEQPKTQADQKQAATAKKPRTSRTKAKPASTPKKPAAPKADPKPKPKSEPKPVGKKFELAKFDYAAPPQSITFRAPEFEAITVRCHPGKPVRIPKDHKVTASMVARKLLIKSAQ